MSANASRDIDVNTRADEPATEAPRPRSGLRSALAPLAVALAFGLPTAALTVTTDAYGRWTIAVGIVTNIACALVGCYLVLRRMSLLGDAISHSILPGIAIGFLLSGQLIGPAIVIGAMAVGMLTAFLTQVLSDLGKVPEDSSMGAVFTSLFAIGVILITNAASDVDLDPGCVLYGLIDFAYWDSIPVLGYEVPRVLRSLGLILGLTLLFVTAFWKELKIVSFDPALATSLGINALWVHYALMAMVAGVTVASFEAVGSILVVAMLIVPAATAHLLTDRLGSMMAVAVGVGALSAALGFRSAVVFDTNVAGMMAVAAGAQFGLAVLLAPRHGLVGRWWNTVRLSLRIAREDVLARLYRAEESNAVPVGSAACREWAAQASGRLWSAWVLRRLLHRGELDTDPNGAVRLTDRGRSEARSIVRAHRLWESFLHEHFALPSDHLHEPAERIEHYLGPALQEHLESELDRPAADPHGRSIPREHEKTEAAPKGGSPSAADEVGHR